MAVLDLICRSFIQLYIEKGRLEAEFDSLNALVDAGDIIGVTGSMKRTDKVIAAYSLRCICLGNVLPNRESCLCTWAAGPC